MRTKKIKNVNRNYKNIERSILIKTKMLEKRFNNQDIKHALMKIKDKSYTDTAITRFIYGQSFSKAFDEWVRDNLGVSL